MRVNLAEVLVQILLLLRYFPFIWRCQICDQNADTVANKHKAQYKRNKAADRSFRLFLTVEGQSD
jgi:hypothetical protein